MKLAHRLCLLCLTLYIQRKLTALRFNLVLSRMLGNEDASLGLRTLWNTKADSDTVTTCMEITLQPDHSSLRWQDGLHSTHRGPLSDKFKDMLRDIPYSRTPDAIKSRLSFRRVISDQLQVDSVSYQHRCGFLGLYLQQYHW